MTKYYYYVTIIRTTFHWCHLGSYFNISSQMQSPNKIDCLLHRLIKYHVLHGLYPYKYLNTIQYNTKTIQYPWIQRCRAHNAVLFLRILDSHKLTIEIHSLLGYFALLRNYSTAEEDGFGRA